ncbi:MAG: tyrosine recombinase XerC [Xanthomonadaceae bacterium]|nr:tyrosine recombinase XerC [Xanthomonadaceae bacterium]
MSDAATAVARFLDHLAVERRLSPRTLEAYRDDLGRFRAFLDEGSGIPWAQVQPAQVRAFVARAHGKGEAPKSLARRLSAIRSFYRYLLREGLARANPAEGVRAPRGGRRLPNVLDADEMSAFLALPEGGGIAARDRAMLELFYSSALRLSELTTLRWGALDLDEGLVRVDGKGGRTRIVPLGGPARDALRAWRAECGGDPGAPVFPGRGGAPISPRAVQSRMKVLAQRQGLWKRVHPHLMRHSCASHLLESSGDLRGVQEMLGHADIATTQVYTHLDFQHLAKVYDAAHPRARRKGG